VVVTSKGKFSSDTSCDSLTVDGGLCHVCLEPVEFRLLVHTVYLPICLILVQKDKSSPTF